MVGEQISKVRDTSAIQLKRDRDELEKSVSGVYAPFIYTKVLKVDYDFVPSGLRASGSHVCSDGSYGVIILSWTEKTFNNQTSVDIQKGFIQLFSSDLSRAAGRSVLT